MNRRDLLKRIGAVVAIATTVKFSHRGTYWGPTDPYRHRVLCRRGIHLRVFVNGEDVSRRCRFFDDTPGVERAELYLHRDGSPYYEPSRAGAAIETITDFEVRRGEPFF